MLWNSRFINEVKFGFLTRIKRSHPFHVFIKLPNNQLFDGVQGVHQVNTYNKKNTELIIMEKYNLETLDKYSWGIVSFKNRKLPEFSRREASEIISKYLDEIYYSLSE